VSATANNISAIEEVSFSGAVATFSDSDVSKTSASFTAVIDWGDGTATAGTISGGSGAFTVTGQHTYADEGIFTLSITVSENSPGTATSTSSASATVSEGDALSGTPVVFNTLVGVPFTGVVADFTNTNTASTAGGFTATINWGDAVVTTGTVSGSGGAFAVSGTHTYTVPGMFSVTVTLSDNAPGTATATVTSTAAATAPPQVIPTPALRQYGLLCLSLLIGLMGLIVVRKNH
jgi:hypothetical protein